MTHRILAATLCITALAACSTRTAPEQISTRPANSAAATTETTTSIDANPATLPRPCDVLTKTQVEQAVGHELKADPNNELVVDDDPESTAAHMRNCIYLGAGPDDPTIVTIAIHQTDENTPAPIDEATVIANSSPGSDVTAIDDLDAPAAAVTNTEVGIAILTTDALKVTTSVTTAGTDDLDAEHELLQALEAQLG